MKRRKLPLGDKNTIGAKITELRKEQLMTQKVLMAKMQTNGIDINYSSLSKLEGQTRPVSSEELRVLAKIFNTTPNDLMEF